MNFKTMTTTEIIAIFAVSVSVALVIYAHFVFKKEIKKMRSQN